MPLKHTVYDTDTHFSINPVTRALINESLAKTSLIQFDHNSERFTFELPRMIEGHDMSLCDIIQVHYNNIDAQTKEESKGVYTVTDMQVSPDGDDVAIFSWLISSNATKFVGSLNFLIRLACTGEEGHVYYVWNTGINSSISVSSGIYNGEAVVEDYADVLEAWKKELEANQIVDMKQTTAGTGDGGVNVWTAYFGDGRIANFEVRNGSKGDKGDKGDGAVVVDSEFDCNSTNPLQNSTIAEWAISVDKTLHDISSSLVKTFETEVEVSYENWEAAVDEEGGNVLFYSNHVPCEGISAEDSPIVDVVVYPGEPDTNPILLEAWSHIQVVWVDDDAISLYTDGECPQTTFRMKLKVVR